MGEGRRPYLGADDAGVASTRRGTYYSHQGRREDVWGKTVEENHPFGVALISSMDPSMIHKGPLAPVMAESARAYLRSGIAAIALAYAIREMGFQARAHTDGNYLVVAPRVAADAGLGVFGRSGLLVHRTLRALCPDFRGHHRYAPSPRKSRPIGKRCGNLLQSLRKVFSALPR